MINQPLQPAAPIIADRDVSLFGTHRIRTVFIDDEVWIVLSDVLNAMEIKNQEDAIRSLREDQQTMVNFYTQDGLQGSIVINLHGYDGIIDNIKRETKATKAFYIWFTNWLMHNPKISRRNAERLLREEANMSPEERAEKLIIAQDVAASLRRIHELRKKKADRKANAVKKTPKTN